MLEHQPAGRQPVWKLAILMRQNQRRVDAEIARLRERAQALEKDEKEFQRLQSRPLDKDFYRNLRKLEGAVPDEEPNFVWRLDFPHVFQKRKRERSWTISRSSTKPDRENWSKPKSKSAAGFD